MIYDREIVIKYLLFKSINRHIYILIILDRSEAFILKR